MDESSISYALQGIAFFWGASLGSFLNVVIYRLPLDMSLVRPGSRCSTCETPIKWYDNIPCLSYILLKGECRACKTGYSSRYALIELMCGLLALALFRTVVLPIGHVDVMVSLGIWLWWQVFVFSLIAITFIDLEHFFIPDEISLSATVIGCAGAFVLTGHGLSFALMGLAAGGGFMLLVSGIGWLVYRREALGLGDAKLMAMIGSFLGWKALPFVLLASSLQALLAVGAAKSYTALTGRPNTFMMTTEELDAHFGEEDRYAEQQLPSRLVIPYGPFIAVAALEATFLGTDSIWIFSEYVVDSMIGH